MGPFTVFKNKDLKVKFRSGGENYKNMVHDMRANLVLLTRGKRKGFITGKGKQSWTVVKVVKTNFIQEL